jgi:hypothetical protein
VNAVRVTRTGSASGIAADPGNRASRGSRIMRRHLDSHPAERERKATGDAADATVANAVIVARGVTVVRAAIGANVPSAVSAARVRGGRTSRLQRPRRKPRP